MPHHAAATIARRPRAAAALLYALLATVICAPALRDPVHLALGHPGNDVWNHLWGYGWVAGELARGELPVHTELLAWPDGGSLWFIDTFGAVLTLPVQWVAGPVAAYNAGIWLNLWLCGFGAFLLAREVVGSLPGALLAGVAYLTAPHLLGQVYNGISETVGAGWLPLALLALRRVVHEPGARRGAFAGAAVGVCALANWYYGLFAGLVLGGLLTREVLQAVGERVPLRLLPWREAALAGFAGVGVAGVLVAGPFALFAATMDAADALVTRDPEFVRMTLVMHNMTDLVSLLRPGKVYSPDLRALFGEELIVVVYLGASLWLPALLLARTPLRRPAASWVLLFAGFLLLTLGPYLYVGGAYVQVGGGWLPLPFLALFDAIPMFSRISHAYRFVVGAGLALAVLAAFVVKAAPRWGMREAWVALALGIARIGESFFLSPAVFPLPVAELHVSDAVARLDGGAVIDLPVTQPVLERSRTVAAQLAHGEAVPYGLNDPVPAYLRTNPYTAMLVTLERRPIDLLPPELPWLDLEVGRRDLVRRGARWIVVHRDGYTARQAARVTGFLDRTAALVEESDGVRIYELR